MRGDCGCRTLLQKRICRLSICQLLLEPRNFLLQLGSLLQCCCLVLAMLSVSQALLVELRQNQIGVSKQHVAAVLCSVLMHSVGTNTGSSSLQTGLEDKVQANDAVSVVEGNKQDM